MDFCQNETGEALYENAQKRVEEMSEIEVDYVVTIGHLGNRGVTPRWTSETALVDEGTTDIQVLLDYRQQDLNGLIKASYENQKGSDRIIKKL